MRCPQCGTRNLLGNQSCTNCGRPFTRAEGRSRGAVQPPSPSEETRQFPAAQPRRAQPDVHIHYERDTWDDYDDYYEEPYRAAPVARQRGRATGCLMSVMVMLAVAAGVVIGLVVATNMFVKPRVAEAISTHIGVGIEVTVREQINAELANLPSGEIRISESEINQRIAEQGNLGPVDDLTVQINPDGIEAGLSAYGLNGNYSGDVIVDNGQVQLVNSNIGGPLQYVVSEGDIERIASDAINRALADSGYRVEAVTLQDGQLLLTLVQ
jgi:hypothetical protein